MLGDHLYEKSDAVKWIDAAQPHKRKRRVKKHSELTIACNDNPDNTNIFEDNMIDDFYPDRPEAMNDMCLFDFVKLYRYNGKDNNGKRRYCKLCKPVIPNHVVYDPNKEGQSDNYYYFMLMQNFKEKAKALNQLQSLIIEQNYLPKTKSKQSTLLILNNI